MGDAPVVSWLAAARNQLPPPHTPRRRLTSNEHFSSFNRTSPPVTRPKSIASISPASHQHTRTDSPSTGAETVENGMRLEGGESEMGVDGSVRGERGMAEEQEGAGRFGRKHQS